MPEEILAIVIVSIVMGTIVTLVKSVLGYRERTRFGQTDDRAEKRALRRGRHQPEGQSLTTSELEGMMRNAVLDAVGPMRERLDAFEDRLEERESAAGRIDLDEHLDELAQEPPREKTIGSRSR